MGNFGKFTCLNIVRCPRGSGGCGLGEVGQLINFDPPLTHSPSISSRWAISIVATAWVGSITTYVTIFALSLPRHSYCTLSEFTSMVPENWSSEVEFVCFYDTPYTGVDAMLRKWATPLISLSPFLMTPITWQDVVSQYFDYFTFCSRAQVNFFRFTSCFMTHHSELTTRAAYNVLLGTLVAMKGVTTYRREILRGSHSQLREIVIR